MNETVITVVGNVAQEPRMRVTAGGTRVVSFRLASTERRYDKALGAWRDGETIFYTVTCWRNAAENVMESVEKGQPVVVHGRLRDASYEKEGQQRTVFEIEAAAMGHDLTRGIGTFVKASQSPGGREVVLDDDEPQPVGGDVAGAADAARTAASGKSAEQVPATARQLSPSAA